MGTTWVCPLGGVRVGDICLTLTTWKPKFFSCWKYVPLSCLEEGDGLLAPYVALAWTS